MTMHNDGFRPRSDQRPGGLVPVHPSPSEWLTDAVIYEIYPQSFADSNGDGIGDLRGVMQHLDYLEWLGVDVIWFNPCFESPFRDAGYDVSDYCSIARRYGTNDDMITLIAQARSRGMRVLLDLVAGHTSIDHPWFQAAVDDPSDNRYIWADQPGDGLVPSPGPRPGWYLKNFFPEQPALNFGYARLDPREPWRQLPDAAGPRTNRTALREIIGYWLDRGIAGFRVDMAFSLVKDDADLVETTALWRELRQWMHDVYPGTVLLPESDEARTAAAGVRGGFDADFSLVIHPEHSALFNNGGAGILPWQERSQPCYFDAEVENAAGAEALGTFLRLWENHLDTSGPDRLVVLPSADHDFSRLACGSRSAEQLPAAFTFLLTWGSIPSIYYGDEIGLRYLDDMPDREGSIWNPRFNRAGCRTPMQWDNALPNAGFSTAATEAIYLPQDPDPDRPTVAAQRDDPSSVLRWVRELIELRRGVPALRPAASRSVLSAGYPLVFLRGDSHVVVVNPHREPAQIKLDALAETTATAAAGTGVSIGDGGVVDAAGLGYGIFEIDVDPPHRPGAET